MDTQGLVEDLETLVARGENEALLGFPLDILLNILSRLPIKTLAVFRCVCKTWRNIVHHPRFTKLHHTRATESQNHLTTTTQIVTLNLLGGPLRIIHDEFDDNIENSIIVKFPFTTETLFQMVGSCNGLLCLADYYDPIYILNPLLGEYIELPHFTGKFESYIVSGFGFDKVANEYKVIRMINNVKAEIFTLGTHNWRRLELPPYSLHQTASWVFVNGALHWMTQGKSCIIAFDVGKEEFQVIPHPSCLFSLDRIWFVELWNLGGYLCLQDKSFRDRTEIWVMKDYGVKSSWTKEYVILHHFWSCKSKVCLEPKAMMQNGNILLLVNRVDLVSYDPMRRTVKNMWSIKAYTFTNVGSFLSLTDIVRPTNGKHSVNTGRWYRKLRQIPFQKPKFDVTEGMYNLVGW